MTDNTATDYLIGYGALAISCASFGTMFVPLKKVDCKDGFFVQWIECSVVIVVGFIINCIRGFPDFQWIAAIGGALYATGNVFSVPIIGGLGMGLGFLIWGTLQVIVGWGVAKFGLFSWLAAQNVQYAWMNYLGLVVTVISGILFVFVQHKQEPSEDNVCSYEVNSESVESVEKMEMETSEDVTNWKKNIGKTVLVKLPYVVMAMILAVFHGLMMSPIQILQQKYPSTDKFKVFDYCWSFYSTVFVFSTLYFLAYCILYRKKAYIEKKLVLPAFAYGVLWTSGMTFWFLSGDRLSQVVAYPITTRLPAIISALLEVLVYKTITGRRNIIYLAFVIAVGMAGVILIALSNQKF